jgi:hypothetical protein
MTGPDPLDSGQTPAVIRRNLKGDFASFAPSLHVIGDFIPVDADPDSSVRADSRRRSKTLALLLPALSTSQMEEGLPLMPTRPKRLVSMVLAIP